MIHRKMLNYYGGGILLKKQTFAHRYLFYATKKPLFFYSFLLLGVAIFLYLTLTTYIETIDGSHTLFYIIFVNAGCGL